MVKSCQAPFFLLRWKQLSSGGFFHFVEDGLLIKILIILLEIVATCYQVLIHFETRLQKICCNLCGYEHHQQNVIIVFPIQEPFPLNEAIQIPLNRFVLCIKFAFFPSKKMNLSRNIHHSDIFVCASFAARRTRNHFLFYHHKAQPITLKVVPFFRPHRKKTPFHFTLAGRLRFWPSFA